MSLFRNSVLLLLSALTLIPAFASSEKALNKRPVLFVVYTDQKFSEESAPPRPMTIIDPIAFVASGKFEPPPLEDSTIDQKLRDQRVAEFEKLYFAAGSQYPLFSSGEKRGSLRIGKPVGVSCESQSASASLPAGFSLGESQFALATSSTSVHPHAGHQRQPSAEESKEILEFVRGIFHAEGVAMSELKAAKTEGIVLTDLYGDGKLDVVAVFSLRGRKRDHRLFTVLSSADDGYRVDLKLHTSSDDLEDLKDLSVPEFIGQLDLDGDGVDEVILRNSYYESWDYSIYSKKLGVWKKLYQGGGGGC